MTTDLNMDRGLARETYRQMQLIRRFEEECSIQYMRGRIRGFQHLYIGEEATGVGAISALEDDDYVVSHYRDHGHALAKGMDPSAVMAELMGRETGVSGGRGGSMHLFDVSRGFMGGYAIVGGQLPVATGLGLAISHLAEDRVVMCFLGDGAVNQGTFHESLNLSKLWNLPVIFFLENNLYGMGSHIDHTHAAGRDLYTSADSYNIPAMQVDGMDVVAVREASAESVRRVRAGQGPVFLEAVTYRFRGHSMADPVQYRDNEEVARWLERDPIPSFVERAAAAGLLDPGDLAEVNQEVEEVVAEAVRFAEESAEPTVDSMYEHVYG